MHQRLSDKLKFVGVEGVYIAPLNNSKVGWFDLTWELRHPCLFYFGTLSVGGAGRDACAPRSASVDNLRRDSAYVYELVI